MPRSMLRKGRIPMIVKLCPSDGCLPRLFLSCCCFILIFVLFFASCLPKLPIAVALSHACLSQRLLILTKASEVMVVVMAHGSIKPICLLPAMRCASHPRTPRKPDKGQSGRCAMADTQCSDKNRASCSNSMIAIPPWFAG